MENVMKLNEMLKLDEDISGFSITATRDGVSVAVGRYSLAMRGLTDEKYWIDEKNLIKL